MGETPVSTPAPIVAAATPRPAPPVAPATPTPPELAPPGVFFLLGKASIETPDGITGLRPGTRVQRTGPGEYTDAEGHKLTLAANQVTNDLRVVRHILGADASEQKALRQLINQRAPGPAEAPATAAPGSTAPAATPRPAGSLGSKGALGSSHTRVRDGYYWELDANGNWHKTRPVH